MSREWIVAAVRLCSGGRSMVRVCMSNLVSSGGEGLEARVHAPVGGGSAQLGVEHPELSGVPVGGEARPVGGGGEAGAEAGDQAFAAAERRHGERRGNGGEG